ncbi:stonustoxin subunit beta [Amia ocellicauda]|uniref:stonustoxin subunit beta n=1 Tax=Amia ocellicauda TaxID=2972642 RepID=UPI00346478B3
MTENYEKRKVFEKILDELTEFEFNKFKYELNNLPLDLGNIPYNKLENLKEGYDMIGEMMKHYDMKTVEEILEDTLKNIPRMNLVQRLQQELEKINKKLEPPFQSVTEVQSQQFSGRLSETDSSRTKAEFSKFTVVQSQPFSQPRTKSEFAKYFRYLTLDPNTVQKQLCLSEGNREVTEGNKKLTYSDHPDRFDWYPQVLCKQALSDRSYWEVEWTGEMVYIGVTYEGIGRKGWGDECRLGYNDKSWSLECHDSGFSVRHNDEETAVTSPASSRVGVYLDHEAGTLSFYTIPDTDTMTLLYKFQTTFTKPLFPGFSLNGSVKFCQLE